MYCKKAIVERREHGNPKPRVDSMGYTVRAGSPSRAQVKLEGEKIWRRVYWWQFSNAGTAFIRVKGENLIVNL